MSAVNVRPAAAEATAGRRTVEGKGPPRLDPAAADKVAKEFESMIVGQMMESMFSGLESSGTFGGGGPAEKPWRSFMLQEYGKAIAEAGTLGIGRMVRDEVVRLYAQQAETAS
ncbi:rod-binding protein [Azospirillum doebereinerae]